MSTSAPARREPRTGWPATLGGPGLPARRTNPAAAALRAAAPALLLFSLARAVGLAAVLLLDRRPGAAAFHRLAWHWDAAWYLDIARHGYDHAIRPAAPGAVQHYTNLAFFPVYPALIRLVRTLLPFVPWGGAALVAAGSCSLVAAWGIHAAASHRYGPRVGTIAALLWGIAPTAAVETAGYSESAFTAAAAWALYAVVTRRWLTAGALSVLAGLTRPTGVAVAAAVMVAAALELVSQYRARYRAGPGIRAGTATGAGSAARAWRPVAAIVTAPLGWLGFVAWTGLRLRGWDAYARIQALWNTRFDFGHATAGDYRMLFTRGVPVDFYFPVVGCLLIAAVVLLTIAVAQRQPPAFVVFSLVILVIAVGDDSHFSCRGRFLLPAFPLLLPIASGLSRVRDRATLVAVLGSFTLCSALYGAYLMLYSPNPP